jgi:hypothetical protein
MEHEGPSLSELLNDEPSQAAPVAEPAAEPAPQDAGQPRDEHGRFAQKGDTDGASPAPVDEPPFEHAAVKGERSRRQQAEQERDELRSRLEALERQSQPPQQPPAPPPSLWEDEQGWQHHFGNQVINASTTQSRIIMSEMLMSQQHPDFAEMKERYLQMERENPAIIPQVMSDPHPWSKAYQIAKNAKTMADLGATDLETLKAKMREELMAEMQAQQPAIPGRPALPPTLTSERSVGGRTGPAWAGPASLDELLR